MQLHRVFWLSLAFSLLVALVSLPKARSLGSPDFKVFYTAARYAQSEPELMYRRGPDRYLYPPSASLFLYPFAFSEHYELHQWSWHFFLALSLFFLASGSGASFVAMLLLTRYLLITFFYGQIILPVLCLLALSSKYLSRRRAGFFWAFASFLKVYPLAFFPAFLQKSSWRSLPWSFLAGWIIFLLPFLYFGWGRGVFLYQEFIRALESKGLPIYSHNQSISALLHRLFSEETFRLHAVAEVKWTLLVIPSLYIKLIALFIGILLSALSWKKAWRIGSKESALSATAFSVLFLSHIVWKDYLLLLYFPLKEILGRWPKRRAWILSISFIVFVTFSSPDVLGAPMAARLDAACVHLLGAILIWVLW